MYKILQIKLDLPDVQRLTEKVALIFLHKNDRIVLLMNYVMTCVNNLIDKHFESNDELAETVYVLEMHTEQERILLY